MSGISTPAHHNDGYTDDTRPDGTAAVFTVHGFVTNVAWSAVSRTWLAPLNVNVIAATPHSSPFVPPAFPSATLAVTVAPPRIPAGIGPLMDVPEPEFTLSARMLLDSKPPAFDSSATGAGRVSSLANMYFANIGPITYLPPPNDLSGYGNLPTTLRYHPIQIDPTISISVEADAIRACHNYIVSPVNRVLFDNSYTLSTGAYCTIRSLCEDTRLIPIYYDQNRPELGTFNCVSRVDFSWEVQINSQWCKFAFLEFKRPGVLDSKDWAPAITVEGATVDGQGGKLCRQMVKYCYTYGIKFAGACDGRALILGVLGGQRDNYHNATQYPAPIPAQFLFVWDKNELKRSLYIWLKYALKVFLQENSWIVQ